MTKQAKNYQRLLHIVKYCEKIKTAPLFSMEAMKFMPTKAIIRHGTCAHFIFCKSANLWAD